MTAVELAIATAERPLIFEGAFDQNITTFEGLRSRDWEPYPLTRPAEVRRVHELYLDAGADVLQTSSWGLGLDLDARADREQIMFDTARRAAEIAKEAAASRAGWQRYVAGIVYPGTTFGGLIPADGLERDAQCITAGLIEGGADFLVAALANSTEDMRRLMAGIRAANAASLPVLAAYELDPVGLLNGENLHEAMMVAEGLGAFSSGVYLTTHLENLPVEPFALRRPLPTHVLADAGTPNFTEHGVIGSLAPAEYGTAVAKLARSLWLRFVGGGWAVTPEHIRSLRAALMGEIYES